MTHHELLEEWIENGNRRKVDYLNWKPFVQVIAFEKADAIGFGWGADQDEAAAWLTYHLGLSPMPTHKVSK